MKTRIQTVTCPSCGEEIYSRARHDYRACKCGAITVDGGFDYLKYSWADVKPVVRTRYIAVSQVHLYRDWNNRLNKYGVITPCDPHKEIARPNTKRSKKALALESRKKRGA